MFSVRFRVKTPSASRNHRFDQIFYPVLIAEMCMRANDSDSEFLSNRFQSCLFEKEMCPTSLLCSDIISQTSFVSIFVALKMSPVLRGTA